MAVKQPKTTQQRKENGVSALTDHNSHTFKPIEAHGVNKRSAFTDLDNEHTQTHMAAKQQKTTQQLQGNGVNITSASTDRNDEAQLAVKQQEGNATAKGHGVNKRSAFTDHNNETWKHIAITQQKTVQLLKGNGSQVKVSFYRQHIRNA